MSASPVMWVSPEAAAPSSTVVSAAAGIGAKVPISKTKSKSGRHGTHFHVFDNDLIHPVMARSYHG
jgi:hypothetical protein